MRASVLSLLVAACCLVGLSRCSLVVANAQSECNQDSDCASGRTCSAHLCLAIPRGCTGGADGGFAAVYGPADAGNAIHLGAVLGLTTGNGASTTEAQELRAAVLALEQINQRSGVGGHPFVLHVCDTGDDTSTQDTAKAEALYLADQVQVPAMLVSTSPRVIAVSPSMVSRGVLVISATATSTEITALADAPSGGPGLVWRTAPSDEIQGRVLNELLLGTSSFDAGLASTSRVAVAYTNDPYGQGLNGILVAGLPPPKTVQSFQFNTAADFPNVTAQLSTFNPDVTVFVGFPQDAPGFITQAATHPNLTRGLGHQWLFTDGAKDPALVSGTGGEVEGSYGTAPGLGAGPAYAVFRSDFLSRYQSNPDDYAYLSYNYDAMYVLGLASAFAIGPSGTGAITGARLAEGLTHLESGTQIGLGPSQFTNAASTLQAGGSVDVEGASGHLDFDVATGDVTAPIEIWQVSGGQIAHVTNVEP